MKASRLLALSFSLAAVSSLSAQETLFSRDFEDFSTGGFFSYFGDGGVTGFHDAENAALLFSVSIDAVNGGYFYGGTGITMGNLGTFASLADVNFSVTVTASADVPQSVQIVLKNEANGNNSAVLYDATITTQSIAFTLDTLVGSLTAADLSSPSLQLLFTIQNGAAWPANAGAAGTNTITFDNILLTGTPGDPVVLYTRDQLVELALGNPVIEKTAEGNFLLKLKLRETTDLANPAGWTDKVLLPADVSVVDGELRINVVPEAEATQFYRLSTQP